MGFRTMRYGPSTTNLFGGSISAGRSFATYRKAPESAGQVKRKTSDNKNPASRTRAGQIDPSATAYHPTGHKDGPKARHKNGEHDSAQDWGHCRLAYNDSITGG
jgi:hypothetical protein